MCSSLITLNNMSDYLALLTSLPTGNSTLRMRLWRSLKQTGCGVLRDGVYVLPATATQAEALAAVESEIKSAGGFAMTVELGLRTPAQLERVRKLFDRSEEYGALVARIGAARTALQRLGKRKADTLVKRLHRAFDELAGIDYYPGPAKPQAEESILALEREAQRIYSEREPRAARKTVRRLDPMKYRGRTWATRRNLWVDRMASAWLIKRFIDKGAKFAWIDSPRSRPKGAVGFDFDGAEFTHVENRVTFEVLLAGFGLDADPALASIGRAVHFLDIGGIPVAEARGLETILRGVKERTRDDDELAVEAGRVFESLYSAYAQDNRKPQQPS